MKKLIVAAAAATLLAASSFAALAAEVTGSITSIDVGAGTIVLNDGKTYQVAGMQDSTTDGAAGTTQSTATPAVLASFKMGDKVTITFDEVDGKFMASAVAPAKS
jgi:Cu/Ag efflux protein CusF